MFLTLSHYLFNVCISYANRTKEKKMSKGTKQRMMDQIFLMCKFDIMERLYWLSIFLPLCKK